MDIDAALDTHTDDRCKVQRRLDEVPDDHPSKARLIAAVADTENRSTNSLMVAFGKLGIPVSYETMRRHRIAGGCRCPR